MSTLRCACALGQGHYLTSIQGQSHFMVINIFNHLIKVKFHIDPPWDGETNVCSNDPVHVTKIMAAMHIYGENFCTYSSLEPISRCCWNLVTIQHNAYKYYEVCSNDDTRLAFDLCTHGSTLVTYAFVRENIQMVDYTQKLLIFVELVFYGPSTHFRSFRARSVNLATLFLG